MVVNGFLFSLYGTASILLWKRFHVKLAGLSGCLSVWGRVVDFIPNVAADLTRSKAELVLENAFLRQQLITLQRQVKHPALPPRDRVLLVLLARKLPSWKQTLTIVQPDTLVTENNL